MTRRFVPVLAKLLLAQTALAPAAYAQDEAPSLADRLTQAATASRLTLELGADGFAGEGYDTLRDRAEAARFVLIGEEHGIAELPGLVADLFADVNAGADTRLMIEISPHMADVLDDRLQESGLDGLRSLYVEPGGEPAFFGMDEESQMLGRVRAASGAEDALWGVDYAVTSDPQHIAALEAMDMPEAARDAVAALRAASDASWARYHETRNPGFVFSFSGDPGLVRAVKAAWPDRPRDATRLLDTLEETLTINGDFMRGRNWVSNARRAAFIRANFLDHWREAGEAKPRIIAKMGASHLVRGKSYSNAWDLGALLPEIAALRGEESVSVFVLPGQGSQVAVFNPVDMSFSPAPGKDNYADGLAPLMEAADPDAMTLIDLAALRPLLPGRADADPRLARVVHGFDYLLVMSGSTPSGEFAHP